MISQGDKIFVCGMGPNVTDSARQVRRQTLPARRRDRPPFSPCGIPFANPAYQPPWPRVKRFRAPTPQPGEITTPGNGRFLSPPSRQSVSRSGVGRSRDHRRGQACTPPDVPGDTTRRPATGRKRLIYLVIGRKRCSDLIRIQHFLSAGFFVTILEADRHNPPMQGIYGMDLPNSGRSDLKFFQIINCCVSR